MWFLCGSCWVTTSFAAPGQIPNFDFSLSSQPFEGIFIWFCFYLRGRFCEILCSWSDEIRLDDRVVITLVWYGQVLKDRLKMQAEERDSKEREERERERVKREAAREAILQRVGLATNLLRTKPHWVTGQSCLVKYQGIPSSGLRWFALWSVQCCGRSSNQ